MAQEFLGSPDVIIRLQQVCGKALTWDGPSAIIPIFLRGVIANLLSFQL
jgi:hypothetical protein